MKFHGPMTHNFRLLQRKDSHKPIRTEFIVLLCPDQRLIEQIQTFTNETFRQWPKEFLQKDRPHLRAYKLSNFFHVIHSPCRIFIFSPPRFLINLFMLCTKYSIP